MTDVFKRPALPFVQKGNAKKARIDDSALALIPASQQQSSRSSSLQFPIMLLTGHEGEIYASKFSTDGTCLASAGYDMKICMF